MAVGFSGSNGGIQSGEKYNPEVKLGEDSPLEVSYFVNDKCNLRCGHCYVGYHSRDGLGTEEFKGAFRKLIDLGATTFGNVGMEPLIPWDEKTLPLLYFFKGAREQNPAIRYGLVTNATLFDEKKIDELADADPTYLDISFDGVRDVHDQIRGQGNFDKAYNSVREIFKRHPKFRDRTFISFTLMNPNQQPKDLEGFFESVRDIGAKKVLVSPYVRSIADSSGSLSLTEEEVRGAYLWMIDHQNSLMPEEGQLLLKSDFDTQRPLIQTLLEAGIINPTELFIDPYGVVFNRYPGKENRETLVNYIIGPGVTQRQMRISHDGHVGNCYGMFFPDFDRTSLGNVKDLSTDELKDLALPQKLSKSMDSLEERLGTTP